MVEIERERDHLAFLDQAGGGDDVFGAGVIEGADLVVRAPFAPIFVLFRGLAHVLAGDFLGRHRMSSVTRRVALRRNTAFDAERRKPRVELPRWMAHS